MSAEVTKEQAMVALRVLADWPAQYEVALESVASVRTYIDAEEAHKERYVQQWVDMVRELEGRVADMRNALLVVKEVFAGEAQDRAFAAELSPPASSESGCTP